MLGWNHLKREYQKVRSLMDEIGEDMKSIAESAFSDTGMETQPLPDTPMPTNGKVQTFRA